MRHAHTISGDDLTLSDRQHREHLALIECRRECARVHGELRELREAYAVLAVDIEYLSNALVARVRRIVS